MVSDRRGETQLKTRLGLAAASLALMTIGSTAPAAADYTPIYFTGDGTFYFQSGGKRGDIVVMRLTQGGTYMQMGNPLVPCWSGILINEGADVYYSGGGDNQQGRWSASNREFMKRGTSLRWTASGGVYSWTRWYRPIRMSRAVHRLRKYYGATVYPLFSDCYTITE